MIGQGLGRLALSSWIAAGWLFASVAHAGEEPASTDTETTDDASKADSDKSEDASKDEPAEKASKSGADSKDADDAVADAQAGNSPAELPGKTYRFVGVRYRGIVVPKFYETLFAEGGRTVYVHAFGPEFAIRKDGFEYNLSAWLGLYNLDDTGFKGKSDPAPAWEIISAKMQILYLTSDFLWSHEFSPEVAINYGVGAGLGLVFGDLHRNQSYPTVPGQNPNDYAKCAAPGDGAPGYCDTDNDHYGNYTEKSWAGGGSKPLFFPWLALQTGLRYKPVHSVATRLDLGFGTSGFFFGLGVDYGL